MFSRDLNLLDFALSAIAGAAFAFIIWLVIALVNTEPCMKCGSQCWDSNYYCPHCGCQLRITKGE